MVSRPSWPPGIRLVSGYRRPWLRLDLVAGLTLTALLVPQGMAYAALAGLPPVIGLYATMIPLIAYALFGPSRIMVLGPDSALTLVVAATIIPLAGTNLNDRVALGGMLALLVGAYSLLAGLARLGFLADLISKPVRLGYLAGIAATVIVGQVPKLLGYSAGSENFVHELQGLVSGLGETRPTALALGAGTAAVILVTRRLLPRFPGVLLAVVGVTALVALLDLSGDVATVGNIPAGLPGLGFPSVPLPHLAKLAAAAVGITLVAMADTTVLSRSQALRHGEQVDANRELIALGLANAAAGLFHGFPVSGSASRTPVAEAAGARTQVTGLVAAGALAVVLAAASTG